MTTSDTFDLQAFLPYLLNQAAEAVGQEFQRDYKARYGLLRNEWRVLFHLGCYGAMTATAIGAMGSLHKTKVSRAIRALEEKRYVSRSVDDHDRRVEHIDLTQTGKNVFADLRCRAADFDGRLGESLSDAETRNLRQCLKRLIERGAKT